MQPKKISISDASVDVGNEDSTDVVPGTIIQPVAVTPTELTASAATSLDVSNEQTAVSASDLTLSAAVIGKPAVQAVDSTSPGDVSDELESIQSIQSAGVTPASPNGPQDLSQPNPVPSLAVPGRGSFLSPAAEQTVPTVVSQAPVPSSPTTPLPQPVVSDQPTAPGLVTQPAVVAGGMSPVAKHSRKRLFLLVGGGAIVVLALLAAAVFGWYLPNTPANVYTTGLDRSGKALDGLVIAATEQKQLETYNTSTIKGSVIANVDGGTYSGDFTTSFDKTTMDGGLNVSLKQKGSSEKKLSLKALSKLPADSTYPDIYLQFSGIKQLGLDALMPGLSDYDDKWISIGSDYLESLGSQYGVVGGDNTKSQVTAADVAEVVRAGTSVTQDYVFTSDPEKAVLVQKSFVGKEELDGMKTYHYKVGINTDHAKDYCIALGNAVLSTNTVKKFAKESKTEIAELKKNVSKQCADEVKDSVKSSDTFDMWVDGKYKLIHKIRVYDKKNTKTYTDIGQTYLGGDKLSFFVAVHDDKQKLDGKFTLDTDVHAAKTSGVLTVKSSSDVPYDVTVKLNAEASKQAVPFTKPSGATSIQDVLKKLGIDPASGEVAPNTTAPSGSLSTSVADAERQDDVNTLRSFVEVYYASKGTYPTLEQLNSSTWRAANMKGFDAAALTPPNSTTATLGGKASATQYSYVPTGCGNDGCKEFTVSAQLSNGQAYAKQSISASDNREA